MDEIGNYKISKTSQEIRPEIANQVRSVERLEKLIDTLVGHLSISIADRQILLEELDLEERAKNLVNLLETQLDLTQMEKKIRNRVKKQMEKSQKEYYLSEQMKALKKEMGEGDDLDDEVEILEKKIKDSGMPDDAKEKVNTELNKFKLMSPMSAEASVVRGYIDWMTSIPWKKKSKIQKNIFSEQSELAQEINVPIVFHNRDSDNDIIDTLSKFPDVIGVAHCFSSTYEVAKKLIDMGFYISFSGNITFKNSHLPEFVGKLPLDRILVETDCPYLSPVPYRGDWLGVMLDPTAPTAWF